MRQLIIRFRSLFRIDSCSKVFAYSAFAFLICILVPCCMFLHYVTPISMADIVQDLYERFDQLYGKGWSFFPHLFVAYIVELFAQLQAKLQVPEFNATSLTTTSTLITSILYTAVGSVFERRNSKQFGFALDTYTEYRRLYAFAQITRIISVILIVMSLCLLVTDAHIASAIACTANYGLCLTMIIVSISINSTAFWQAAARRQYTKKSENPHSWKTYMETFCGREDQGLEERDFQFLLYAFTDMNHKFEAIWSTIQPLDDETKEYLRIYCKVLCQFFQKDYVRKNATHFHQIYRNFRAEAFNDADIKAAQTTIDLVLYLYLSLDKIDAPNFRNTPIFSTYLTLDPGVYYGLYNRGKLLLLDAHLVKRNNPKLALSIDDIQLSDYERCKYDDVTLAFRERR